MKHTTAPAKTPTTPTFRIAYTLFLVLVVFQLLIGHIEDAISNLGIAMIFDPFDHTVKWNDRPRYQRIWLCTHLTLTLGGFAFLIFR